MKRLLLVLGVVFSAALAGCGDEPTAGPGSVPTATAPAGAVTVYVTDETGERLVARDRPLPAGADAMETALAALASDGGLPTQAGSAEVAAGVARVDFGREFEQAYPAGSAAEVAFVAPLVFTLTGLPGVEAVLVTVEGRAPDPPGASFDLSRPLRRSDLPEDLLP